MVNQNMVKQSSNKKKRGRPKGSKNKITRTLAAPARRVSEHGRYKLKSRIEKDAMDADQTYYFIYDLNRGAMYPEIIARFTVETEANLCVEFLNETRTISKKEYAKKSICVI